jgi:hypothetical protein
LEFVILVGSSKHGNILPHKFLAQKERKAFYVCFVGIDANILSYQPEKEQKGILSGKAKAL